MEPIDGAESDTAAGHGADPVAAESV